MDAELATPSLAVAVRTLMVGGFILEDVQRNPGYLILQTSRTDEFGASHNYCFAVSENDQFIPEQIQAAKIVSDYKRAHLILIGKSECDFPTIVWDRFINLFGGPVFSTSPLEPEFAQQLSELAFNRLPDGLSGRADDLFEDYTNVSLEFILGTKVVRYGQDRRFEARPDGIVLPYCGFSALYDAKAYSDGYEVTQDSIRQFKSYVEDFSQRYDAYLSRLNAFIVVSGSFPHRERTLEGRSRELFSECGVPLVFLNVRELIEIIDLLSEFPYARRSINWPKIFAEPITKASLVSQELETINKDGIAPRS